MEFKTNHPKQKFIFYVAQDVDEVIAEGVKNIVSELRKIRKWTLGPPQFIDTHSTDGRKPGLVPDNSVGGYIEIYSAHGPEKIPYELDRQNLEEVITIVDALKGISEKYDVEFEFGLDEVFVGALECGEMDKSLAEGLIGEWKRQLSISM